GNSDHSCDRDRGRSLAVVFLGHSPAHEMHNLQPIAFLQLRLCPAVARSNVAIEFYGNAICLELQLLYQLRQGCTGGTIFRLSVDDDGHSSSVADSLISDVIQPAYWQRILFWSDHPESLQAAGARSGKRRCGCRDRNA